MKRTIYILFAATLVVFNISSTKQSVGIKIGDAAPAIVQANPEGKNISLGSLQGKLVLIDFWASWCKPCRQANPQLVATYNKFKDRKFKGANGFTVYSVSLDRTKEAWKTAIKEDQLSWPNHVSDLMYWDNEAVKRYDVHSIPHTVLVDGNGIIIAKKLSAQQLEYELSKRLDE